jgi:hypothetical protein
MLYFCFTPALPLATYVTAVILLYLNIHLYSCFTSALLLLYSYFSCCVCSCRLTGLVECLEESEGLRRDGAWEHGVLQQMAAGEAPLHDPPHVSLLLLIHLAAAQAPTRLQERQRVSPAAQVRDACHMMPSYPI